MSTFVVNVNLKGIYQREIFQFVFNVALDNNVPQINTNTSEKTIRELLTISLYIAR